MMAKIIFFISIVVITLSSASCASLDIRNLGTPRSVAANDCMFGPFKDTAMLCLLRDRMYTGCILQGLNWFNVTHKLHEREVVNTFGEYIKKERFKDRVIDVARKCVNKANIHGGNTREQVGEKFVKCLDDDNAFNALFPKAFCEEEDNTPPSVDKELVDLSIYNFPKSSRI